ncbi:monocarboxylate transporter 13 [Brachionichthys hirsutus]|uniref:monocarboxylate transporter 13 n=1 Tax=Brachionichthys hirsutus TaxID=412623 RepID=UPI0036046924
MTGLKRRARRPEEEDGGPDGGGPDGGWGWVLVGAMFVSVSLVFGLLRSVGVFFVAFEQHFGESAQAISWISSTSLAAQQFFSPLSAALCNAYDTRRVMMAGGCLAGLGFILASQAACLAHLYLTIGVVTGFGWSMVFTPMVATVIANFTRRRSLALGLGFSSIGISSFAFNPLFQLLVQEYAWRGALLILGGLSFNIVPCGALIRPKKRSEAPAKADTASGPPGPASFLRRVSSYMELPLLLHRPYMSFVLSLCLLNIGYFVPYFHLVPHSRHAGFTEYQAAFVMSAAGASDTVGRILSGWFSDLGVFRLVHIVTAWMALVGVAIMLLPVSSLSGSYPALVAVSLFYGFFAGALNSVVLGLVPQIVGVERTMGALGLLQAIESVTGLLGGPLSGFLKDVTGDYLVSFVVSGSFLVLAALPLMTLPRYFSCTDPPPPPPRRRSSCGRDEASQLELEQMDSSPNVHSLA